VKIAYLAPEIPALSATFVYKEILALQQLNVDVVCFSVHKPHDVAAGTALGALKKKTSILYQSSTFAVIKSHLKLLLKTPTHYFSTLLKLVNDIVSVGIFSRNALGLVFRFFYAGRLAEQLSEQQCQHLHIHFAHVPTDIGMYAACLADIPFSVTAHANDIFERGWLLTQKVERCAFFATISEFNRRYLLELGVDADKLKIIRCGVDAKQFSTRNNFVSAERLKIGTVGRLVEKKGVDTLIKAAALIKQQGLHCDLLIAGSGPLDDELRKLVESLALSSTEVQFLGAMPNTEVAAFIQSLDIFILPCKQDSNGDMDGVPVVLMEAMLSGVPVISTELSGIPELVVNKETGLLVVQNDEVALAGAITLMLSDDNLRGAMQKQAIIKVSQEFSLLGNAEKLKQLFSGH